MGSKSRMAQKRGHVNEVKITHPDEVMRQLREMPWLWGVMHDWTTAFETKIHRISTRQGTNHLVESNGFQEWFFHIEQEDPAQGARLAFMHLTGVRTKSTLRQGILYKSVLYHMRKTERLLNVAVLVKRSSFSEDPARIIIFRCNAPEGFGLWIKDR